MSPKASTRLLATQSDERLAAMARAGHDRAFEALVHRYRPPLLRYCRRLSIPDSRAEDVVQQSLLQAWSALRRGADVRELRPWLYRIAHNIAINLTRDSARDGSGAALDLDSLSAGDSAVLHEPDLAGALHLRDALTDMAALPDLQREVIFRTALAGHSHQEVATALGITDGAVRGLLYRARATLRTAITAVTPPPLIAWMSGPGQGIATERLTEIAAGGGLGAGMLAKGALALLAAGTLITSAAIVHSPPAAHHHTHAAPAKHQIAALAAPSGVPLRSSAPAVSHSRAGSASRVSAAQRSAGHKPVRLRIAIPAPSGPSRSLALTHRRSSAPLAKGPAPTSATLHIPGSSTTPPPSSGSSSSGSSTGAGGGSSGSGSGPTGGGSSGGGSGTTGSGGSGGSGTGSGGSGGSGSGGGSSGGGSSGGSSGGGSSGGGSGGSNGGGSQPESSPPPPSSGSGSTSTGPVTTVVHEVTGLLEHTVHGILGH